MIDLRSFRFLADENISTALVDDISKAGFDIIHVSSVGLNAKKDLDIIQFAFREKRIIVTQDSDFGKIVYTSKADFLGIIYLRPGHLQSSFHLETFKQIANEGMDLKPPFLLVAERSGKSIKIRLRNALN